MIDHLAVTMPLFEMPVDDFACRLNALHWMPSCGQVGRWEVVIHMQVLWNTVYFYNCKVFGLRCYDEHNRLH